MDYEVTTEVETFDDIQSYCPDGMVLAMPQNEDEFTCMQQAILKADENGQDVSGSYMHIGGAGISHPQMASQCSKVKVARAQQTRAFLPASATPFGMTTTSLPLTVRLSTHLCLPSHQHARAQRSSAHSLELRTFSNIKVLEASGSGYQL
jgi:hypothetical protein